MEIRLIRHGKSSCDFSKRITSWDYREWVIKYGEAGICDEAPANVQRALKDASIVFTSDFKRAIDSAQSSVAIQSDSIYRELELPYYDVKFLKLNPRIWTVFYRFLWLIGFSKKVENKKRAKRRAKTAAQQLEDNAREHGIVILVGHGFFNRYIGNVLTKRGWTLEGNNGTANWTIHTYTK
ncbi:histidine phosphatase family protein [Bacillus hwajinpoensis]|uniref:Histidine phosphatase family protein n=1 Tax=Guptibacillus hwajinpoensis TaxID=208199 RepID=A0A845F1I3_9BACL|nr:histidine phosphatase family protein [Pseudalkalibacillus hwajinpoensis]